MTHQSSTLRFLGLQPASRSGLGCVSVNTGYCSTAKILLHNLQQAATLRRPSTSRVHAQRLPFRVPEELPHKKVATSHPIMVGCQGPKGNNQRTHSGKDCDPTAPKHLPRTHRVSSTTTAIDIRDVSLNHHVRHNTQETARKSRPHASHARRAVLAWRRASKGARV